MCYGDDRAKVIAVHMEFLRALKLMSFFDRFRTYLILLGAYDILRPTHPACALVRGLLFFFYALIMVLN